jgi:hypothetical protein
MSGHGDMGRVCAHAPTKNRESAKRDSAKGDSAKRDSAKRNTAKRDSVNQRVTASVMTWLPCVMHSFVSLYIINFLSVLMTIYLLLYMTVMTVRR